MHFKRDLCDLHLVTCVFSVFSLSSHLTPPNASSNSSSIFLTFLEISLAVGVGLAHRVSVGAHSPVFQAFLSYYLLDGVFSPGSCTVSLRQADLLPLCSYLTKLTAKNDSGFSLESGLIPILFLFTGLITTLHGIS